MPKNKNQPWTTTISPAANHQRPKAWMIATAVLAAILVVLAILVVALTIAVSDGHPSPANQTNSGGKASSTSGAGNVDVSHLDGSKLITKADLKDGEIPDHFMGNKNAKVVAISYEDFACSHCQALSAYAEQIWADYQDRALFIHRSFSLGFPNSDKTLRAAEAAYLLGGEKAYWAMTKLLYQDTQWTGEDFFGSQGVLNGYAEQIGLNVDKFRKAMSDQAVTNKLDRDKALGTQAGVAGTPTWFISGQQVTARDADIRAALDAALSL